MPKPKECCDECNGTGWETMTCGVCGGSDDCDHCDGGEVEFICHKCHGTGGIEHG